ncbi:MAG: YidC/Oxa1 family insertase periplasmic-domain containing protein [Akkermansiaceae bacterium]
MDRKAWIIVTICSILLAYSYFLQKQNAAIIAEREAKEQEVIEAVADTQQPDPVTGEVPPSGLAVEKKQVPQREVVKNELETETNTFTLSSRQGGIVDALFKDEKAVNDLSKNVRMNDLGEHEIGAILSRSGEMLETTYTRKDESADSVTYVGRLSNGLGVRKIWKKVSEGEGVSYRLSLEIQFINDQESTYSLSDLYLSTGSAAPIIDTEQPRYRSFFWQEGGDFESEMQGYFDGGMFSKEKLDFVQETEAALEFSGVENQFFATIVDPQEDYRATVRARPAKVDLPDDRGGKAAKLLTASVSFPDKTLNPKEVETLVFDIFVGPKNNGLIRSLEGEKDEVMNYGFFSGISCGLNWMLNRLSGLFGGKNNPWSWGWAVIAVTVIIRTLMWPLHAKSTRTMKRMSKLQPKMKALKEKYPDDPNKMNQETMKLYREFGVNPMGGCLPMLAQIPIFFGFFTMLQYAVELRNQPFLWVTDLSQPDTIAHLPFSIPFLGSGINILPILMAVTMVLQMRMTPQTGDAMQRRIFMFMPIIFFFFCYNFASALALYWTTQNIFSITQTWIMQKMPEPELKTSKNAGKKTMMQKLAERAEQAQKMQKAQKKAGSQKQQDQPKKPRGPKTGG